MLNQLKQSQQIGLVSHILPDGDAIGSLCALKDALQSMGKEVYIFQKEQPAEIFNFLKPSAETSEDIPKNLDLIIALDIGDTIRTGFANTIKWYAENNRLALIDHHPKAELYRLAYAKLHDNQASSCTELIFQVITQLGVKITPNIATAILTGLYTDTGGFQHTNTSANAFELASKLLSLGAKLQIISETFTHNKSVSSLKILGLALERLHLVQNKQIAVSVITNQDLIDLNASEEDRYGIINQLTSLNGIRASLLLLEHEKGMIRGSLRGEISNSLKVSLLAKLLGGGGHDKAAGFSMKGELYHDDKGWQIR